MRADAPPTADHTVPSGNWQIDTWTAVARKANVRAD